MIQNINLLRHRLQKEVVLILVFLLILPRASISAQLDQATRSKLLNAVVENLNKQALQMIDSNTMFMNATGYNNVLTYNYKITSVRKDQVDINKLKKSEFKNASSAEFVITQWFRQVTKCVI